MKQVSPSANEGVGGAGDLHIFTIGHSNRSWVEFLTVLSRPCPNNCAAHLHTRHYIVSRSTRSGVRRTAFELVPGLRADEIIGTEVRSSDDKIVGEVRNIVFGTKDRKDYAIVASGGFFTRGKDSIVVPIRSLKISQERASFFLPITKDAMKAVPLMPDQEYQWLSDLKWRTKNDAIFQVR